MLMMMMMIYEMAGGGSAGRYLYVLAFLLFVTRDTATHQTLLDGLIVKKIHSMTEQPPINM